jgi:glycosyltransferase involved in cell wall biosynthesis
MVPAVQSVPDREQACSSARLPRLLVLSDCSPEASVSGQLLLYRLLRKHESRDVTVMEGDVWPSTPDRRLPGVDYYTIAYKPWRYESRLHPIWNSYLMWRIGHWADYAAEVAKARRSEAVLTVAHMHLWILAAAVARRLDIPLHLMIHDDWPTMAHVLTLAKPVLQRCFGSIYAQAASRLCVSPFMESEYRRRYGCPGTVLLPSRGEDIPDGKVQVQDRSGKFTLAFAGSILNPDYPVRLRGAAAAVEQIGGRLALYTNASRSKLESDGLNKPNVIHGGFLASCQLTRQLATCADALFLPMSFRPEDRAAMEVCFPSKLTDYTAAGLPIVIWGPEYSAAARWAADNPDAALCVCDPDPAVFAAAVRRLAGDIDLRRRLATGAVAVGNRQFSFETAIQVFHRCLLQR